jgi:hypothetical protein
MQTGCIYIRRGLARALATLALAVLVVLGQATALGHDLGHACERLDEGTGGLPHEPDSCPNHAAFADLSHAATAPVLVLPPLERAREAPLVRVAGSRAATRLAFRSRAPPRIPA